MRGAGLRLTTDVRRVWQCAACGAERKVGAQVTTVRCQCEGRPAMKLVEGQRRERPLKELASPYLEFVFEPGELAPPRSQQDDGPAAENTNTPTGNSPIAMGREVNEGRSSAETQRPPDAETKSAMEREVNEGGIAPPTEAASQRPARRNDRRGDRGPAPARGPQGSQNNGPRPDQRPLPQNQSPRKEQHGAPDRRPDASTNAAPVGRKNPPGNNPPRQQNDRRNTPPTTPPPAVDNSGFGEGIHDD